MITEQVYIWDLHSGARERILRGTPAHSMIATFSSRFRKSADANSIFSGSSTSASALLAPTEELPNRPRPSRSIAALAAPTLAESSSLPNPVAGSSSLLAGGNPISTHDETENMSLGLIGSLEKLSTKVAQALNQSAKPGPLKPSESISSITTVKSGPVSNPTIVSSRPLVHKQPIRGASPLPGVATLQFDLFALMAPDLGSTSNSGEKESRALVAGSEESQIAAVLERVPGVEHSEDKVTSSSKEGGCTSPFFSFCRHIIH